MDDDAFACEDDKKHRIPVSSKLAAFFRRRLPIIALILSIAACAFLAGVFYMRSESTGISEAHDRSNDSSASSSIGSEKNARDGKDRTVEIPREGHAFEGGPTKEVNSKLSANAASGRSEPRDVIQDDRPPCGVRIRFVKDDYKGCF